MSKDIRTSPTDTPKRLSDDAVAVIIQNEMGRYLSVDKDGEIAGAGPASYSAARLILERLSTLPSQGKVERAREMLAKHIDQLPNADRWCGEAQSLQDGDPLVFAVPSSAAIAAITQALTESSGQGTDGTEAIVQKLEKLCVGHDAQSTLFSNGVRAAIKVIRALSLPVSADGRALGHDWIGSHDTPTGKRCRNCGVDELNVGGYICPSPRLKSKQPSDTGYAT